MALSEPLAEPARHFSSGWKKLLLRLAVLVAICVAIALLLYALEARGFLPKLVYSLSIGLCCWTLVETLRWVFHGLYCRLREARGLPRRDGVATGWMFAMGTVVLAVPIGVTIGVELGDHLTGFESPSLLRWQSSATRFTLAISLIATVVMFIVSVLMERLAEARAQAAQAARLASENQLRLLQAQLEPHMLFNTLANLRVLIGLNPAQAQAMLDHLIAFLRSTLQATRSGQITLKQEFAHLADYLALMQLRMGPRLAVQLDLPDELASHEVPALLLQPLVENAIRHGLEPAVQGGTVRVSARRAGETLELSVRDTGVGLSATPAPGNTGFGTQQVRERLATQYGAAARLQLQAAADDQGTLAVISLPLTSAPTHA